MKTFLLHSVITLFIVSSVFSSEIHQLAETGDLDGIKNILQENPGMIEDKDDRDNTPLLIAASNGRTDIVAFLLDQGADPNARNPRGSTALHLAAYLGHTPVVELLLQRGFEVDSRSLSGFTPFLYACYMGHAEAAGLLIKNGADMTVRDSSWGALPINWACSRGSSEIRDLLLTHNVDLGAPCTRDSSTPIFWASFAGNIPALEFLINNGINAATAELDVWTPLHNAARSGHTNAVMFLIDHGSDINAVNNEGVSALLVAVESGNEELIDSLLARGADIFAVDSSNMSFLSWAAMGNNLNLVKLGLSKGLDANHRDDWGATVLERAIWANNPEMAILLVEHGADVNFYSEDGDTPLKNAIIQGNDSVVTLLFDHDADPDMKDQRYGRTCLHWAAIKGYDEAVKQCVSHGATIDALDSSGYTPLYYAHRFGHRDVTEYLIENKADTKGTDKTFADPVKLLKNVKPGEAVIWYTGHCGFAIKTENHLLIFDYWNRGKDPKHPSLANGHIYPKEIANENVMVFVTHEHGDHFDSTIFDWNNQINNITYVYGCRPEEMVQFRDSGYGGPEYEYFEPHQQRTINGIKITTIASNDGGVGYLVEVDGLTIYHAGDHAGWREGERDGFTAEIDYLSGQVSSVDMAFLNATGCHVQDTIALEQSIQHTLEKLHPHCWFPTHSIDSEYRYRNMADKITNAGYDSKAVCTETRGDHFIYKGKNIL